MQNQNSEIYNKAYKKLDINDNIELGPCTKATLVNNPLHLSFQLARHRFVSRVLEGRDNVLEIGCQEGFTSLLMHKSFKQLTSIDIDQSYIDSANKYILPYTKNTNFYCHNIIDEDLKQVNYYDGAFTVDVLEHIDPKDEYKFMKGLVKAIKHDATAVIGIPSLEQQKFTSEANKIGHINCKTFEELTEFAKVFFQNVLVFTMNDEIVHMGFPRTANYLFAVCTQPIK